MTVLACDLGGTRIKIGVVQDGRVLAREVLPARSGDGLLPQLPRLVATWRQLLGRLGLGLCDCAGVSIAFPSLVDRRLGRIRFAYGKYPDAPQLDLRAWARRELQLPLALENDARMAVIGEWRHGAARGFDDVVMITLGTGLGTGAIAEGRVLRGRHEQMGVLGGHLVARHDGRICSCGNRGCAEAEASTATLPELVRGFPGHATSALARVPVLDYAQVFALAAQGDAVALAVRDHSLGVWSACAVNLVHAYDPELLVLGGGIMQSADVVLPAIAAHVQAHAHTPWGQVRVVAAALGDAAALVAGEWLVAEAAGQP